MELYPNQVDDGCHLNPHNRFLFIFCHASDVSEGWGFMCCGHRSFSFRYGVLIFSAIMLLGAINDLIDITSMDSFKNETNEIFLDFYKAKLASDILILASIIFAIYAVCDSRYWAAMVAYYLALISFYLNTAFCVFTLTQIKKQSVITFMKNCFKGTFFTYLFWCFFDYVLLLFAWILFCFRIDLRRKRQIQQNNLYTV